MLIGRKLQAFYLVICLSAPALCGQRILMSDSADLDKDGRIETVSVTYARLCHGRPFGGEVVVARGGKTIWQIGKLNPWKLQLADVDGDKRKEIVIGVYKKSPFDPVMAKRPFVYNWDGERLAPRWRGSRLSRRFTDFALADLDNDGKEELVALEIASKGEHYVTVYRWAGFGFEWIGSTGPKAGLQKLIVYNRKQPDVCVVSSGGQYVVKLDGDKPRLDKKESGK